MSYASEIANAELSAGVIRLRDLLETMSSAASALDVATASAQRITLTAKDLGQLYDAAFETRTTLKALSGNATPSAAEDALLLAVRNAVRDLQVEMAKLVQATSLEDAFDLGAFDGTTWASLDTNFNQKPIPLSANLRAAALDVVSSIAAISTT